MEIVQGITRAAKKLNAPVILQCSAGARKYASHGYLVAMVKAAAEETGLPIALHLDHGPDFETCKACIDGGFTSVMIDGSSLPYEENIALTKKVVEYAHAHGVVVEGELGTLAGVEDDVKVDADNASYTRPEEVYDLLQEQVLTHLQSLSVQATVLTSLSLARSHSFVLTFLKKLARSFLDSQSYFTVHHQLTKTISSLLTNTAVKCLMLSVFLKICFVKQHQWQYVKSMLTLTFVSQ